MALANANTEFKIFNRGNILVKLYKCMVSTNKQLKIDRQDPVDYEELRKTLNKYLREDQEVTQEEITLIMGNRDPLLTFIILLALGLGLQYMGQNEVKRIFVSLPDTVISPTIYNKITEDYRLETTTDVSYYDTIHTFSSGIRTLIPKKLLEEIKGCISDITKGKDNILPPPKVVRNDSSAGATPDATGSTKKNTFSRFLQRLKLPKAYSRMEDNKTNVEQEGNIYSETVVGEQNYTEVNTPKEEDSFQGDEAIGTSTPKTQRKIYPNLRRFEEETDKDNKIEKRIREFNEENLAIINKDSLEGKVNPTDYVIPYSYKARDEYENTFSYFRNSIIRIKYVLKTPIIADLIYNMKDTILQDTLVKTGKIIDDTITDIVQKNGYTIIEEAFTYPPLNLSEDTLFTLIVLPQLSVTSQRKLCIMLNWIEKITDVYYYKLNKEYLDKLINRQAEEEKVEQNEQQIMMFTGSRRRCTGYRRTTTKDNKNEAQRGTSNNRGNTERRNQKESRESDSSSSEEEESEGYPKNTSEDADDTTEKRSNKSTNLNGVEVSKKNFMQELQMIEKLIKIHEPHIPKFDGSRHKFINFIIAISNRFEQRDIPPKIKIELTKHFMTGAASSDIEGQIFTDSKWSTFKKYLTSRYILDKRATIMEIRKKLDNMELEKSTINEFYMKIREQINLLAFLDPEEYKDINKTIVQKLLSGIPSNYYYRIKATTANENVGELLSELEKIENLEKSLAHNRAEESKFQDPALHNIDIYQINKRYDRNGGNNHQNNFRSYENKNRPYWMEYPCRLHGGHKAGDCKYSCGFCLLRGSHKGEECRRKNEKINHWIEECIQKFGVTAKVTAENCVKRDRIIRPTEEEFGKMLKGEPSRQQGGFEEYKGYTRNNR